MMARELLVEKRLELENKAEDRVNSHGSEKDMGSLNRNL